MIANSLINVWLASQGLGLSILLLGVLAMIFLGYEPIFSWVLALAALIVSSWSHKKNDRWYVVLMTIYVYSLLAFNMGSTFTTREFVTLLALYIPTLMVILWLGTNKELSLVLAMVLAIGVIEMFVVLLFWPINFPSRAMIVALGVFWAFELIDYWTNHQKINFQAFVTPAMISVLVIGAIIWSSDWFLY